MTKEEVNWKEIFRKYKEWYMTEMKSWQEAVNVFRWIQNQVNEELDRIDNEIKDK